MLAYILSKTDAVFTVTKVEEEKRRAPLRPEIGSRVMIMGDRPYVGYIVTGTVGPFTLQVKTFTSFPIGHQIRFAELWQKRDPARDFAWG